jgi:hypothetical protein
MDSEALKQMDYESFKGHMEQQWRIFDREATEAKNSQQALEWMVDWYRRLPTECEEFAGQVVSEWLVTGSDAQRFDALVLARRFRLSSAAPALVALRDRLREDEAPPARFELKKVEAVLHQLG